MAVELKVPEVGESIVDVQIGEWLKKEGEVARLDEPVVTIETDKVTVELPAPVTGVVVRITHPKGTAAKVGDVIGFMEEGAARPARAEPAAAPRNELSEPAPRTAPAPAPEAQPSGAAEFPRVMPAAARALATEGVALSAVTATGPGGRVLKEDVERAAEAARAHMALAVQPPVAPVVSTAAEAPRVAAAPPPAERPAPALRSAKAQADGRVEEVVPMSLMRRRIAERLVESQNTGALLTTFNEIDMSAVVACRAEYQEAFQKRYGIKLGFMSFFVKAAVDALKLVPDVNAEIRGTDIVYRNFYDIGVAVGGGKGLVVPIIRGAERLGFAEVELQIADFGKRAKVNQLKLDELQGGTFTVSNGGIYGSLLSTPIINPPQSGILGLHAIQDRAVVIAGKVEVRPMMYVALTYDHRLIDGREAVTFLKRIKECVEAPARMLLEI